MRITSMNKMYLEGFFFLYYFLQIKTLLKKKCTKRSISHTGKGTGPTMSLTIGKIIKIKIKIIAKAKEV